MNAMSCPAVGFSLVVTGYALVIARTVYLNRRDAAARRRRDGKGTGGFPLDR